MQDRKKVLELFYEQADYMNERVEEGIERYRKGDASLSLTDEKGEKLCGAKIKIKQKSHEFKYGCNLFMLDELETEEKNALYKKYMASFGNMATLPFYWNATEPEENKTRYAKDSVKMYRRPPIDLCVEFCEQNGIEPREHALAYEAFFPKWLHGESEEKVKAAYEKRCREISERYANKIPTIEVTNEMEWDEGKTSFYDNPDYIRWCFETARKYFPNNQLVINEWTGLCWQDKCRATDKYYSYIEANLLKGAPIEAIGMQYHMFIPKESEYNQTRKYYSPKALYAHLDLYSDFNMPLQITEVTLPAYSNDAEDEAIQAELIEKLYTIWFSHKNVEQIIYWNMVDGYAHVINPDPEAVRKTMGDMSIGENIYYGGLLRFDMTPKPAYYTIKNLFEKKWHTELEISSDDSGNLEFRGFYGDYEIEITLGDKTYTKEITLSSKKENNFDIKL